MGFLAGGAFLKGFVETEASMEKTKKMLEGISGSAELAEKDFQWLLKFGEKNSAVASLDVLQKSFVKLKVAGVKFPRPQNAYAFILAGADLIGTRAAPEIIDALDQMRAIGLVPPYAP